MNKSEHRPGQEILGPDQLESETPEPSLVDGLRFLYQRRVKLLFHMMAIFGLGTLAFFISYYRAQKSVAGTVGLSFRGIEKGEYPSGRKFSVEDFRSPGVLSKALNDAAISTDRVPLADLASHTYISPIIPADIQNRWKKQEQAGAKKEEYSPNEFQIAIEARGLTDQERIRLFDSIINRYQESLKFDQKSAGGFIFSSSIDYEKFADSYDYWDIPDLFLETYKSLSQKLDDLIKESTQFPDASYQLAFREIRQKMDTWERTRLQALQALTYQGRLVSNKEVVAERIRYRIQDLEIQIRQKSQEAGEAVRLLEVIDRPKALLAGQLNSKEGLPVIDASALDKLVKSDYVGPVVERISKLQNEAQQMEAEKARLEKQLSWLPKSSDSAAGSLPPVYKGLLNALSEELKGIIESYDRLLERYLVATVTSLVVVKQSPVLVRNTYSPLMALPAIAFLSCFLAVVLLGAEHLFLKARASA